MRQRLMIAMLAIACSLPVSAQMRPMRRGPAMGGPGGNRVDFLAGYLALTDSQKTQAQAIFEGARSASDTLRGQLMSARENLTAAIKANGSETQLDSLAAAVGTIEGQLLGIQAKASAKFYALLTADQKTKYDEVRPRRGGPGPGGPPPE